MQTNLQEKRQTKVLWQQNSNDKFKIFDFRVTQCETIVKSDFLKNVVKWSTVCFGNEIPFCLFTEKN